MVEPTTGTSFSIGPEWISAVSSFALLLLTGFSVFYAYKAYKHQKDRSKKEAACSLAKYYANNIIDKYADINYTFDSAGITELISSLFSIKDINTFEKDELVRLLSKKGKTIDEITPKIMFVDAQHILNTRMLNSCSTEDRDNTFHNHVLKDEEGKNHIINGAFLQADFSREIDSLLNDLEWFAMNCKYGLADEALMYQSLHQTYLSTIWMLYYHISIRNESTEDKFYTNVIWLFTLWRNRLDKIASEADKKKQRLMKKANSVKAKVYEGTSLK